MPIEARRVYRLGLTIALALAAGYALALPIPFMPALFAIFLASPPRPPLAPLQLLKLAVLVLFATGTGLLLVPLLHAYPATALALILIGLFVANHLSINKGQAVVGAMLTVGLTLITAAGYASYALALTVVQALVSGIVIAIVCHWLVYPWLPEAAQAPGPPKPDAEAKAESRWLAARAVIVVFPAYLMALTNPQLYMPIVMKAVSLGQQDSVDNLRHAGRELLGSTLLGGVFAMLFWVGLKVWPNLWMFFLWMLLFGLYFAAKLYGVWRSRFAGPFWINTAVTMLIMLGPAVADSANGKDVYMAFFVRMSLIIAVTLYAVVAIRLLDGWRTRYDARASSGATRTAESF